MGLQREIRLQTHGMTRYLASRFAGMVIVMLLVATIVFFITRLAPGDPAAVMLGDQATAADIAKLRASYGLDKPLPLQFAYWLGELVHGNLGQSIFLQRPVTQALLERAEPTFFLTLFSIVIATLIGVPCGIIAAVWRGKTIDQFFSGFAMLGASIPSFWFGLILMQIFAVGLGWFPVAGYGDPGVPLSDRLHHLVLPSIVLGVVNSALILRFTRASMLDVLGDDHIRTARAKGLSEASVILRHALRNALIPVITVLGLTFALLIGGAIVTETVFGLPGVGNLVVSAVLRRDYPVIQGALLVIAGLYVLINLAIDLLYLVVDPRVKYAHDARPQRDRAAARQPQLLMPAVASPVKAPSRSPSAILVRKLFRRRLVLAGAAILVVVALLALFAPWITPYDPMAMKIRDRTAKPDGSRTGSAPTSSAATCFRAWSSARAIR